MSRAGNVQGFTSTTPVYDKWTGRKWIINASQSHVEISTSEIHYLIDRKFANPTTLARWPPIANNTPAGGLERSGLNRYSIHNLHDLLLGTSRNCVLIAGISFTVVGDQQPQLPGAYQAFGLEKSRDARKVYKPYDSAIRGQA
jgi:hypothetical protein